MCGTINDTTDHVYVYVKNDESLLNEVQVAVELSTFNNFVSRVKEGLSKEGYATLANNPKVDYRNLYEVFCEEFGVDPEEHESEDEEYVTVAPKVYGIYATRGGRFARILSIREGNLAYPVEGEILLDPYSERILCEESWSMKGEAGLYTTHENDLVELVGTVSETVEVVGSLPKERGYELHNSETLEELAEEYEDAGVSFEVQKESRIFRQGNNANVNSLSGLEDTNLKTLQIRIISHLESALDHFKKVSETLNTKKENETMTTTFETVHLVNGTNVEDLSKEELIQAIKKAEAEKKELGSIETKSEAITQKIEGIDDTIASIVKILDSKK